MFCYRIFILIKNHNLLTPDIYGACHDLLNKIPILKQKKIDLFRYINYQKIFIYLIIKDILVKIIS